MSNVIRYKLNTNNTRIFSAQNRQKNKNIQPGPEKQHSYKKGKCVVQVGEFRAVILTTINYAAV